MNTPAEFIRISIADLVPSRWQPRRRFAEADLLDLANDINVHGVITPLIVWLNEDHEFELIAGERRTRALYALCMYHASPKANRDLATFVAPLSAKSFVEWRDNIRRISSEPGPDPAFSAVAVRVITGAPAQLHEMAVIENIQRADLAPIEEAHALQDLITDHAYTQRDLAVRIGKSQPWISQRLTLLNLAPAVADQVIAGELDVSIARDIARLGADQQAAVAAHVRKWDMKQKAASNFVARLLEFSDPDAWLQLAGAEYRRYGLVLQEFLRRLDQPARITLLLTRLATDQNQGRLSLPADRWGFDKLICALGITGKMYDGLDDAWAKLFGAPAPVPQPQAAPSASSDLSTVSALSTPSTASTGSTPVLASPCPSAPSAPTCATCTINLHRELVHQVTTRSAEINTTPTALWPRCAPGVTTCALHTPAGAALLLDLPYMDDALIRPDERTRLVQSDSQYGSGKTLYATDIPTWSTLLLRRVTAQQARNTQRHETEQNGVANALRRYVAAQAQLTVSHVYSQPCTRCAFYSPQGERCERIRQPPPHRGYTSDGFIAALWRRADKDLTAAPIIGVCKLFHLADLGILPRIAGARLEAARAFMLEFLHAMSRASYGNNYEAPRWLPVHRTVAFDAPSWSDSEPYLRKALADLDSSQLMSLAAAWQDRLPPDAAKADVTVFDPHKGRDVSWQRIAAYSTTDPAPIDPPAGDQPLYVTLATATITAGTLDLPTL